MKQPIPHGGTSPLKAGDRVQIVPEWQDPGDDQFESFVIEVPENCTQVRIQTHIQASPSTPPSGSKQTSSSFFHPEN